MRAPLIDENGHPRAAKQRTPSGAFWFTNAQVIDAFREVASAQLATLHDSLAQLPEEDRGRNVDAAITAARIAASGMYQLAVRQKPTLDEAELWAVWCEVVEATDNWRQEYPPDSTRGRRAVLHYGQSVALQEPPPGCQEGQTETPQAGDKPTSGPAKHWP